MKRYAKTESKYPLPGTPAHLLLAFDLGKRKVGMAVFLCGEGTAKLVGAEVIAVQDRWSTDVMAAAVQISLKKLLDFASFMPSVFVCEWPQKYAKGRKFHKDLDDLYAVGHAIVRKLNNSWSETYTPSEWKGNVPKRAHKKRIVRELTLQERATLQTHIAEAMDTTKEEAQAYLDSPESHDLWDAIGIGLFATARTRKGGTRV